MVTVLLVMLGLLALGVTGLWLTSGNLQISAHTNLRNQALYVAEAGIEAVRADLNGRGRNIVELLTGGNDALRQRAHRRRRRGAPNGLGAVYVLRRTAPGCATWPSLRPASSAAWAAPPPRPLSSTMGTYTVWIRNDTGELRQGKPLADGNGTIVVRSRGVAADGRIEVVLEATLSSDSAPAHHAPGPATPARTPATATARPSRASSCSDPVGPSRSAGTRLSKAVSARGRVLGRLPVGVAGPAQQLVLQGQAQLRQGQPQQLHVGHRAVVGPVVRVDHGDHALAARHREHGAQARAGTADQRPEGGGQGGLLVGDDSGPVALGAGAEHRPVAQRQAQRAVQGRLLVGGDGQPERADGDELLLLHDEEDRPLDGVGDGGQQVERDGGARARPSAGRSPPCAGGRSRRCSPRAISASFDCSARLRHTLRMQAATAGTSPCTGGHRAGVVDGGLAGLGQAIGDDRGARATPAPERADRARRRRPRRAGRRGRWAGARPAGRSRRRGR